jgi:cobalt-zinc-cadmium efflux system membrane fusion protein
LISTRDLEAAQNALETATARLESAGAEEKTASQELERQQKLAASDVAGSAEVQDAGARLAAAQADARTRRAQVQNAREELRLAERVLKRERTTFSNNIANRREFSTARANLENAENSLTKARQTFAVTNAAFRRETEIFRQNLNNTAQVQTAGADLVSARSDLEAARSTLALFKSAPGGRAVGGSAVIPIRAPLAGIIQERDVARGEVIDTDRNLLTIVDLSTVHVDMNLPERDISRVRIGSPVSVIVDAVPGRTFAGQIELIHTQLNPKTRTVEAHAELKNPGVLRPGMFARGTIRVGNSSFAIMVPASAVQDMENKKIVFVSGEKAGTFEAREVVIGDTTGGLTHIKSGLKPGEKAVVKGAFMVKAQAMKAELGHEH